MIPFRQQLTLRRLFINERWHIRTDIALGGKLIVRTSRPLTVQEEKRVRSIGWPVSAIITE